MTTKLFHHFPFFDLILDVQHLTACHSANITSFTVHARP